MITKKIQRDFKLQIVANIQHFIKKNSDYEMGNLEAEELLDYVIKEISPIVYNQALNDAKNVIQRQVDSLLEELYVLEVPLK